MATNRAFALHKGSGMRWIVGILAALALTGCGVGVDDPEGQAAAGVTANGQAQAASLDVASQKSSGSADTTPVQGTGNTSELTLKPVQSHGLPQDPVPYDGPPGLGGGGPLPPNP